MLKKILSDIEKILEGAIKEGNLITKKEDLEKWKIKYLGRKSELNKFFALIPQFSSEEKRICGEKLNNAKNILNNLYEELKNKLVDTEKLEYNLSFPGEKISIGNLHIITKVIDEITEIFKKMGFGIAEGPEIESDYYNFEALNIPQEHPARDIWDTFYIKKEKGILLRTHTSPVQIRIMEKYKPPLRIIAPGKCFRRDAFDASHSPLFHQIEGLMVDKEIKFTHLKGVLVYFIKNFFKKEVKTIFSPSYFPFTEPSAEVSISCILCEEKGCPTCSFTGFLEILGCGMVHPQVFRNVGYDPETYTGFAFGMGVERLAMLKYRIEDIRYFYLNDKRFLEQF